MTHDEGWLGVVLGLLVESLHGRHFPSFFRRLEAVGNEDEVAMAGNWREELRDEQDPELGELIELQRRGVKEMEEAAVFFGPEKAGPDEAGDTEEISTDRKADESKAQPHESSLPRTGRS